MLKSSLNSARLGFLPAEIIGTGVHVFPVNFVERTKPFDMTYFEVEPGCQSPLDQHGEDECWIILQGHGVLQYDGQVFNAKPHDIFYFEAEKPHQINNTNDVSLLICSIYWYP